MIAREAIKMFPSMLSRQHIVQSFSLFDPAEAYIHFLVPLI